MIYCNSIRSKCDYIASKPITDVLKITLFVLGILTLLGSLIPHAYGMQNLTIGLFSTGFVLFCIGSAMFCLFQKKFPHNPYEINEARSNKIIQNIQKIIDESWKTPNPESLIQQLILVAHLGTQNPELDNTALQAFFNAGGTRNTLFCVTLLALQKDMCSTLLNIENHGIDVYMKVNGKNLLQLLCELNVPVDKLDQYRECIDFCINTLKIHPNQLSSSPSHLLTALDIYDAHERPLEFASIREYLVKQGAIKTDRSV